MHPDGTTHHLHRAIFRPLQAAVRRGKLHVHLANLPTNIWVCLLQAKSSDIAANKTYPIVRCAAVFWYEDKMRPGRRRIPQYSIQWGEAGKLRWSNVWSRCFCK